MSMVPHPLQLHPVLLGAAICPLWRTPPVSAVPQLLRGMLSGVVPYPPQLWRAPVGVAHSPLPAALPGTQLSAVHHLLLLNQEPLSNKEPVYNPFKLPLRTLPYPYPCALSRRYMYCVPGTTSSSAFGLYRY